MEQTRTMSNSNNPSPKHSTVMIQAPIRRVTISLASPDRIQQEWSKGEVVRAETIDYRTHKPEIGGLFCERIFGPIKDYECYCGKYKGIRYKGIRCDKCGVEVIEKKWRRVRTGHITLQEPIVHPWYFRYNPPKLGMLLGYNAKKLEQVVYYDRYVVLQPGDVNRLPRNPLGGATRSMIEDGVAPRPSRGSRQQENTLYLQEGDLLTAEEYSRIVKALQAAAKEDPTIQPESFVAKLGAQALEELLKRLNLDKLAAKLREDLEKEISIQRRTDILRRLKVVEEFRTANRRVENKPVWMILRVIPVVPPDLRPLIPLPGGRFTAADLNDLYRRLIQRNNRLKRMMESRTPEILLNNERRMLQEAVDALLDSARKRNQTRASAESTSGRILRSLSENIKGKQGRFRQNLLGKRVDYSGRSVIVVGPHLKLHECGLPKDMAAELFKPFIIRDLLAQRIVRTEKSGRRLVERKDPRIWPILENILRGHPVLLNRAPTLHRLGIQAFQPKLVEGKAIQLHPLVCTGYNADFDGDQMAVHVPLSQAAILESQILLLSSHNILHPANGAPIAVPSQDMVLGLYYITKLRRGALGEGRQFSSLKEVLQAYHTGKIALHAIVNVRLPAEQEVWVLGNEKEDKAIEQVGSYKRIYTTAGRVIFNETLPPEMPYVNGLLTKGAIRDVIMEVFRRTDHRRTADFLDKIKELGFNSAFKGGLSFTLHDVIVPSNRELLIQKGFQEREEIREQYQSGFISEGERYNKIIDLWTRTSNEITDQLIRELEKHEEGFNPIYMMMHSGARGSREQVRQLCALRGLMNKPHRRLGGGEIIETPILSSLREGLNVIEYFISTHGARKGLADTALKTADAGYLTRKLVDVAQDVVVTEEDCGTLRGFRITALYDENDELVESLASRIAGRFALNDIYHPETGEKLCEAGAEITDEIAKKIEGAGVESVEIRSPITCEAERGICQKCYGRHLAIGRLVEVGEAVGIIAAQSIGEPGTQLTLRTFHTGGTAQRIAGQSALKAKYEGIVEFTELRTAHREIGSGMTEEVVLSRTSEVLLLHPQTQQVIWRADLPYASVLKVKSGQLVGKGQEICTWDPYARHIVAGHDGTVQWNDLEEGETYRREVIAETQREEYIVVEPPRTSRTRTPGLIILNEYGEAKDRFPLPSGARIMIRHGEAVKAGDILARTPIQTARTADITGGLPRVSELFEARSPNAAAVLAEIDGIVRIGKRRASYHEIEVASTDGKMRILHKVPVARLLLVYDGDRVRAGQPLCDGPVSPHDILRIKGISAVAEYLLRNIQLIYAPQAVRISTKHLEIILRQMLQKVEIVDPGDTIFLPEEVVDKSEFFQENAHLENKMIVTDAGGSSEYQVGSLITPSRLQEVNAYLEKTGLPLIKARPARPAIAQPKLLGISRAASTTRSWLSAASFQETIRVLIDAAVTAKTDELVGLKENVITGQKIPAGTGYVGRRAEETTISLPLPSIAEEAPAPAPPISVAPTRSTRRSGGSRRKSPSTS
ncbi:MAG: DNA-directed RNA polymerase subunit beta' [Bacteroidia bacterium]|nr:DNA-directed RNA polymerase subunit beta' [Bacteroidia bacterium]MDW8235879.1 DNA-directed RNA polymerase subunit beta' [Bacteroidia bacterium]